MNVLFRGFLMNKLTELILQYLDLASKIYDDRLLNRLEALLNEGCWDWFWIFTWLIFGGWDRPSHC